MARQLDTEEAKPKRRHTMTKAKPIVVNKVKSTIHISVEASQRLDIHATMMGTDRSGLVEQLIQEQLRRYVVSDRKPDTQGDDVRSTQGTGQPAGQGGLTLVA